MNDIRMLGGQNNSEAAETEGSHKTSRQKQDVGQDVGQGQDESGGAQSEDHLSECPDPGHGETSRMAVIRDKESENKEKTSSTPTDAEAEELFAEEDCLGWYSKFPDVVGERIFGFLDVHDKVMAAQVCSSWHYEVYRPCQWRDLKLELDVDHLSEDEVTSLKEREIKHVVVMAGRNNDKLSNFFQKITSLESVDLLYIRRTYNLRQIVSDHVFLSLKKLVLYTPDAKSVEDLQASLKSFPHLQSLEVLGEVSSGLVAAIGKDLQGLQELTLSPDNFVSDLDFQGLSGLHSLQHLVLWRFRLQSVEDLAVLKTTLKKLTLSYIELPTDEWAFLLLQAPSLEELDFQFCRPCIGKDGLDLLRENFINLKRFKLETLEEDKTLLDNTGFKTIAQIANLQELSLNGMRSITAEGFESLQNFAHLKALTLADCSGVTEEGMKQLGLISSLQKLELCNGQHGDVLLRNLGKGTRNLKCLLMKDISSTESADMAYISQISSLTELHLDSVSVGPIGMELLSKGTFTLRTLDIKHCGVTMRGLMPLFQRQTLLREVTLEEVGIEEEGISHFRTILPNLEKWDIWPCTCGD